MPAKSAVIAGHLLYLVSRLQKFFDRQVAFAFREPLPDLKLLGFHGVIVCAPAFLQFLRKFFVLLGGEPLIRIAGLRSLCRFFVRSFRRRGNSLGRSRWLRTL